MNSSKLRFSAAHLLYFLSLSAASTSLFGWFGLPIACFVVLVWIQIFDGVRREEESLSNRLNNTDVSPESKAGTEHRHPSADLRRAITRMELLAVLLIVALLVGLFMPARNDADPMQQAEASMKQVAKALQAYRQYHGQLPVVIAMDEHGLPQHSWRSLILPFMEEATLAAVYRMDEPWNGPNNSQLAVYRPWHFRIYYPQADTSRETTALHFTTDGRGRCLVFESESDVENWMAPSTSDIGALGKTPEVNEGFWNHGFFVSSYRGRLVVCGDQTVVVHPSPQFDANLASALPSSVGEAGQSSVGQPYRQWHFDNALRLSFFLVAALYPLRWLKHAR